MILMFENYFAVDIEKVSGRISEGPFWMIDKLCRLKIYICL